MIARLVRCKRFGGRVDTPSELLVKVKRKKDRLC